MKNVLRIISTTVTLCFLLNTTLYADITLSPALKFGGLQDPRLKEMGRIEMALLTQLTKIVWEGFAMNPDIIIKKANEYRDSKFADTHVFFAEREVLSNGKIKVKARIVRDDGSKTTATYYATFSTQKDENNGFNIDVYTESEWNENEKIIKEAKLLPKRASQYPEDAKAIARYVKHEQYTDNLIKFAHEMGYAQKPVEHVFDYKQEVKNLIKKLGVKISKDDLESIINREFFIIPTTHEIVSNGLGQITIIDQFGIEHDVLCFAHSSNSAVHVIIGDEYYKAIIREGRRGPAINYLRTRLVHEIGLMLGLPILEVEGDVRTNNILDQRWQELQKNPNAEFETLNLHVVDLDNVRTRDYAMAGEIENSIFVANRSRLATKIVEYYLRKNLALFRSMTDEEMNDMIAKMDNAIEKISQLMNEYCDMAIAMAIKNNGKIPTIDELTIRIDPRFDIDTASEIDNKLDYAIREEIISIVE